MFLDSNKKLVAVLTTAKTTLNMPVTIDAVDLTTTTTTPLPFQTYTNGTTPVDILSAPAASTVRKVNGLSIYGRDTAAKIIRVYGIDSTPTTGLITAGAFVAGNDYQIVSVGTTDFTLIGASANTVGVIFTATGVGTGTGTAATAYQHVDLQLQIDDTLCYTDAQGWYAVDSQGNLKSVQAASATSIANAITTSTEKATPIAADKVGIVDSVTGLLNWSSFTDLLSFFAAKLGNAANVFSVAHGTSAAHAVSLDQVSLFPTVTSAVSPDIFGAAGATINYDNTTPVTATSFVASTASQVGSIKTLIPLQNANMTASANLIIDGATSGTFVMPAGAKLEVLASTTTLFQLTTISASGSFTATLTGCTTAPTATVYWTKIGNTINLMSNTYITATSNASGKTLTGAPATLTPRFTAVVFEIAIKDNGAYTPTSVIGVPNSGTIPLYINADGTGFTSSGTFLIAPFSITYQL